MSYCRSISALFVFLLSAPNSQASDLDQHFQRCASAALKDREQSAATITIDNKGLTKDELNHDECGF